VYKLDNSFSSEKLCGIGEERILDTMVVARIISGEDPSGSKAA
jgi:hypothetical protein